MSENKTCADCKFFIQHYRKFGKRYSWLNCRHCKKPRLKARGPFTTACPHFQENAPVN